MAFNYAHIPIALKERNQWLLWRLTERGKVPYSAKTNSPCDANDPANWLSFEQALQANEKLKTTGIGFAARNGIILIDLDNCIHASVASPEALQLIKQFNTYTEYTPSGNGLRIIVQGDLPSVSKRYFNPITHGFAGEIFANIGFCTITGNQYPNTPNDVANHNGTLSAWFDTLFTNPPNDAPQRAEAQTDQRYMLAKQRIDELLKRNNGFAKTWRGDGKYASPSEAIWGLWNDLLRITLLDRDLAYELLKLSPLYQTNPKKWDRTAFKYDANSAQNHVTEQLPQIDKPRSWLLFNELYALPKPRYLIDDIVAGEITVIYAPSASGKTFLAIHYAMLAAREHQVMYVAAEDLNGVAMRATAWLDYHKGNADKFMVWPNELNLMNGDTDIFIEDVTNLHLELIVIDTLALCMIGGDENSTKDMGLFIHNVKRIQNATGAAIVILHHTDKKGIAERGNSALRGAAYTMYSLTKLNDVITVENVKAKNTRIANTQSFNLLQIDQDRAVITGKTMQLDFSLGDDHIRVLQHIHLFGDALSFTKIKEGLKLADKTLSRILDRLVSNQLVAHEKQRAPWVLTDKGREFLTVEDI